jgi:hypothetical protein
MLSYQARTAPSGLIMQDEALLEECYLPIFDDSLEVSEKDLAAAERFRIVLSAFPVVMPALAFLGYDAVVPIFHELISFTQSWYSVDGGRLEAELIIPIINGLGRWSRRRSPRCVTVKFRSAAVSTRRHAT